MEERKCLYCGSPLNKKTKYCSIACKDKYFYHNKIMVRKCAICGKEFNGKPRTKCCSEKCRIKSQKIHMKNCPVCNKRFKARGNGVYCSAICKSVANSPTKGLIVAHCKVCHGQFKTFKDNPELVCSDKCGAELIPTYINEILNGLFSTTNKDEIRALLKERGIING